MWLDLDGLRVVHACWDDEQIAVIEAARERFGDVSTEFLCEATERGTRLYLAIEDVLKGKEITLPAGCSFRDKDGNERHQMRIKWYSSPADQTFASYALPADDNLPKEPLPDSLMKSVTPYPSDAAPVFFGHYWLPAEQAERLAANVAC
ncbi:MAG: diadenosine tetraphosphatase, partial [Planctomycetes bacterium]|nr:diadenosine tetraphosphatase [Planctomycetota bacterium]